MSGMIINGTLTQVARLVRVVDEKIPYAFWSSCR
jgi:hypothetical protein